ncbi:MAG: hypothetical protein MUP47_02050 [Phycisphaerae bacterium]|nr:hypothetical protein [Phycisphaerae bacterium]
MPGWFRKPKSRSIDWPGWDGRRRRHRLRRASVWLLGLAAVVAGAWVGLKRLERYAVGRGGGAAGEITTVRVAFTARPEWMPLGLARDIAQAMVPPRAKFTAQDLSGSIYRLAADNPHVAEVRRVTWHGGDQPGMAVVEIDCRFRMPIARVELSNSAWGYAYVDREGFRLPEADVPQWVIQLAPTAAQPKGATYFFRDGDLLPTGAQVQALHYITIRGAAAPAPEVGQQWPGQDIQDGLRLVALVLTRSYANQVTTVDVRNHDGRISRSQPHLRMYAQVGEGSVTDIRFGRFPTPGGGDYEVAPEIKMSHLDDYFLDHGKRLAGLNSYIDLQYDQLIYSVN